jgi:hypothetical protein
MVKHGTVRLRSRTTPWPPPEERLLRLKVPCATRSKPSLTRRFLLRSALAGSWVECTVLCDVRTRIVVARSTAPGSFQESAAEVIERKKGRTRPLSFGGPETKDNTPLEGKGVPNANVFPARRFSPLRIAPARRPARGYRKLQGAGTGAAVGSAASRECSMGCAQSRQTCSKIGAPRAPGGDAANPPSTSVDASQRRPHDAPVKDITMPARRSSMGVSRLALDAFSSGWNLLIKRTTFGRRRRHRQCHVEDGALGQSRRGP